MSTQTDINKSGAIEPEVIAAPTRRDIVAKILNIENDSSSWEIIDSIASINPEDPDGDKYDLVMVNYKKDADMSKYGHLRGVVVDVDNEFVVCQSQTYEPTSVMDSIDIDSDCSFRIVDTDGNERQINIDPSDPILPASIQKSAHASADASPKISKLKFNYGYEGITIRLFKHNGKVYRSSNRKIDIVYTDSRMGDENSMNFIEIYKHLNGPDDHVLFDPNVKFSPFSHIFIMVHQDTLDVSKEDVQNGYMVYVGMYQTWYPSQLSNNPDVGIQDIDLNRWSPSNLNSDLNIVKSDPKTFYHLSPDLTIDEANYHLRYGYSDKRINSNVRDNRLKTGEFIIMTIYQMGVGEIRYRILSTAYNWRSTIRNHVTNIPFQFYTLTTDTLFKYKNTKGSARGDRENRYNEYVKTFQSKYPTLKYYDPDEIVKTIDEKSRIYFVETVREHRNFNERYYRMYNVWLCYLMALPYHKQREASRLFSYYYTDRIILVDRLTDLVAIDGHEYVRTMLYDDEYKHIIRITRESTRQIPNDTDFSNTTKDTEIYARIKNKIKTLIYKEYGHSLYRMIKQMNDIVDGRKHKLNKIKWNGETDNEV